ncbi:MAG: hypothetical protein BGP24_00970 [Lysobacterales bacterium 69-70]|uniref:hypothetical protein n=1 Tax=Tahibacter caeni TaxID=1453545 RepID=UPI00086EF792|nr:hypothetical protein [Tahibacter caeni]MBN8740272.1 hypothetical protein [Xanthomonadaceae bacterium]ODU36127.1 MAG: hypothetical protein ABS97_02000 [Xanthomonadaceae bacterium SCN 69-320]ODV18129.1 MAG: hypothetical protein ABT27_14435 [Xanthomonadaceae bacterium SCN 69-25]OJY99414.1 MAG: hypothetical protein BGP24_00970 [Xanthomonadales bacterium 69-70]
MVHPLLNVLADEDEESLRLQVRCGEQRVQIPPALARRGSTKRPASFSEARCERDCPPVPE